MKNDLIGRKLNYLFSQYRIIAEISWPTPIHNNYVTTDIDKAGGSGG